MADWLVATLLLCCSEAYYLQRAQVIDSLNAISQCLLVLFILEKDVICNRKRRYNSWKWRGSNVVTYGYLRYCRSRCWGHIRSSELVTGLLRTVSSRTILLSDDASYPPLVVAIVYCSYILSNWKLFGFASFLSNWDGLARPLSTVFLV